MSSDPPATSSDVGDLACCLLGHSMGAELLDDRVDDGGQRRH
jgi:hypothetical protein